jgi:hypothetical protein
VQPSSVFLPLLPTLEDIESIFIFFIHAERDWCAWRERERLLAGARTLPVESIERKKNKKTKKQKSYRRGADAKQHIGTLTKQASADLLMHMLYI